MAEMLLIKLLWLFLGSREGLWFLCVVFMSGAPKFSTSSGSGFKRPRDRATVSSDRLVELGIELGTLGYKATDLSTTPRRLL